MQKNKIFVMVECVVNVTLCSRELISYKSATQQKLIGAIKLVS